MKTLLLMLLLVCGANRRAAAAETPAPPESALVIGNWLRNQTNIQTWAADFLQIRTYKTLVQPLTSTGHISFAAPNNFRWELGKPAQTVAVRHDDEMTIIYPQRKRAERYSMGAAQSKEWKSVLSLLEVGFPRSQKELENQFNVQGLALTNGFHQLGLQPRAATARKLMPLINLYIDTNDFMLKSIELRFTDGSTMRSFFTNAVPNAKLDSALFNPQLGPEFKVIEPLKN